jgi:hypothetical protein
VSATSCWIHTPSHYATASVPRIWKVASSNVTVDANDGYDSGPALTASSQGGYVIQPVFDIGNPSDVSRGARVKVSTLPTVESILLGVVDADLNLLVCITVLPSGQVASYRGAMAELLAVSDDPITAATQLRLGFIASLSSGGGMTVYLDDEAIAVATGVDLTGTWAGVYVGCHQNIYVSHDYAYDDLTIRPDLLCDVSVSGHANLDETDPDGDTTIVSLGSAGSQLRTTVASATTRNVTYGFMTMAVVKALTEPRGYAPLIDFGTTHLRSRQPIDTDDYQGVPAGYPAHPDTGLPFTTDELEALTAIGGEARV